MPTISLCMIVCNEENNIRRCLESACRYVDEIIIVDTGSTDRTKSICSSFDTHIFDYKWADDFAEARNYSISKASCDWILLLDADEELDMYDFPAFQQHLQENANDLLSIQMIHFCGSETDEFQRPKSGRLAKFDKKRSYVSNAFRILRNNGNSKFIGKIHERIDINAKEIELPRETKHFFQIFHYGYMEKALNKKTNRNITILLKEKDEQPDNPWLDYHLAAEYYRLKNFAKAYQMVITAIVGFLTNGILPPALAYKLKYDLLIETGNFQVAYHSIEKAIALYPDYVDLHFYKGIIQYNHKEYEKAKETFSYCLVLGEANMKYLILSGVGSFFALYYLGQCYDEQQKYEQAAEAYRQAIALYPEFGLGQTKT